MKKNHCVIKAVLKRANKPLDIDQIRTRWFDQHRPLNLQRDLDEMLSLGILTKSADGSYSLIKEGIKNG